MASLSNTFESAPSGTLISTSNSEGPSSNAFDSVTLPAGATLDFDNAHPHSVGQGTRSLKVATGATSGATYAGWTAGLTGTTVYGRCYLYFESNPTGTIRFFQARGAGANWMSLNLNTTPRVAIVRASGGVVGTVASTMSTNTLYRVEWVTFFDAASGVCTLDLFSGDSLSPLASVTNTPDNFGGTTADEWRFGNNVGSPNLGPIWIDDVALSNVAQPGPFIPSIAPKTVRRARTGVGELLQV